MNEHNDNVVSSKKWSLEDILFTIIFILQFFFIMWLTKSQLTMGMKTSISLIASIATFALTIFWYKEPLKAQWVSFRATHFWKKIVVAAILVFGVYLLLSVTRQVMPLEWLNNGQSADTADETLTLFSIIASIISPLLAPFSEEILFRYVFIGKTKGKSLQIVMLFVQAIFFGLIHTMSFGGNPLATIPYMVIALYFGIIYMISKNIWMTIIVHFLFNASEVVVPIVFLVMMLFK